MMLGRFAGPAGTLQHAGKLAPRAGAGKARETSAAG
jgi:hypothetical protein